MARRLVPGAAVTLRSDVLASLADAPLQHGAYLMFDVVLAAAAAFGLAALLADLALGAAERHQTLARLATMGLEACARPGGWSWWRRRRPCWPRRWRGRPARWCCRR